MTPINDTTHAGHNNKKAERHTQKRVSAIKFKLCKTIVKQSIAKNEIGYSVSAGLGLIIFSADTTMSNQDPITNARNGSFDLGIRVLTKLAVWLSG